MKTVIILGRGHSGSRIIASFLRDNRFFIGSMLNPTLDKKPYDILYKAGKQILKHYTFENNKLKLVKPFPDPEKKPFIHAIDNYFKDIFNSDRPLKAAKFASITFLYRFMIQYYPDFYYLWWTRSISKKNEHRRGNYEDKHVIREVIQDSTGPESAWKIYYDLIMAEPKPKNFLHMRMEDFVLDHDRSVEKLETWLDMKMTRKETMTQETLHKMDPKDYDINYLKTKYLFPHIIHSDDHENLRFDWLKEPMKELGYIK